MIRYRYILVPWLVVVLLFLLAAPGSSQQAPPNPSPQVLDVQGGKIRVVTVASGLVHPWGLAFLPDGRLLVTEKNGRLRMIREGTLEPDPVWTSPTPPGQGGDALHFVAVHPQFAQNRLVYVSYPKQGERGFTLAVARGHLNGGTLEDVQEIFIADAWETGGNLAGRIFFSPDALLYVTIGDRDRLCCNGGEDSSLRAKAQKLDNHVGKTLRLRDDGSVPTDNPFVGRVGAKPEIFTYGHRNGYNSASGSETSTDAGYPRPSRHPHSPTLRRRRLLPHGRGRHLVAGGSGRADRRGDHRDGPHRQRAWW